MLEAPYAFLMLRPQLAFGPEDERFFVHGMLNEAGKFEQLEMVGEAGAAAKIKEPFLSTLRLWEFRPASREGKPTPVEVLLIIPRPDQPWRLRRVT